MRLAIFITSIYVLVICWFVGAGLGNAEFARMRAEREQPYARVMQEAVNELQDYGMPVAYPDRLPPIVYCAACLQKSEAFGAFTDQVEQIILPENFDITTLEGHSILVHEYGHFLLTRAGVPSEQQEKLCLALGNMVFQKFFTAALN